MPAFNSASTLHDSAQSVLDQTFDSLELIVVDDGSTDGTAAVAEELTARDARVRLIGRTDRGGPARARNTGITAAHGRYLAFCDADDLWLPTKLERQLHVIGATGAALVYSAYHRIAADFAGPVEAFLPQGRVVRVPEQVDHRELLRRNVIGCLTAMYDRRRTGEVGMPDLAGAEDWALWLQITREYGPAVGLKQPLALYRSAQTGSHSASRIRAARAVWRVLRQQEHCAAPMAAMHLATDALDALRKSMI